MTGHKHSTSTHRGATRRPPRAAGPPQTAERVFGWLATGPQPLALPAAQVGLPGRRVRLDTPRRLLSHPDLPGACRDAAARALVRRARTGAAGRVVAAVGMVLPEPRRLESARGCGDATASETAVLARLPDAVRGLADLDRPRVERLCDDASFPAAVGPRGGGSP